MNFTELILKHTAEKLKKANEENQIFGKEEFIEHVLLNIKEHINLSTLKSEKEKDKDKDKDKDLNMLLVSLVEDGFEDENENSSYYQVLGYDKNEAVKDDNLYALTFLKWEEYFNMEINENSLRIYGEETCLLAIMHEMTFFGIEAEEQSDRINEETDRLTESMKECESGTGNGKYYSLEDMFEEFGWKDTRTEEEKKSDRELMIKTFIGNNILQNVLLGTKHNDKYINLEELDLNRIIKIVEKEKLCGLSLYIKCKETIPNIFK